VSAPRRSSVPVAPPRAVLVPVMRVLPVRAPRGPAVPAAPPRGRLAPAVPPRGPPAPAVPPRGRSIPAAPPRELPVPVVLPRELPVPVAPPRELPVPPVPPRGLAVPAAPPRGPPVPVAPPRGRAVPAEPELPGRPGDVPRRLDAPLPADPARPVLGAPEPDPRFGPAGRPFDSPSRRPRPFPATANSHLARSRPGGRAAGVSDIHRKRIEGRYQHGSDPQREDVRRRPTLPRGPPRSTIGAEGLNFRVRNGTGCFPFAMATETLWRCQALH
jgi:hypothetical protein